MRKLESIVEKEEQVDVNEINCILDNTIRRYPAEPLWLMSGDFNSYSPKDADVMPANTYYETHSTVLRSGYADALRDRHSQFFRSVPTVYGGWPDGNGRRAVIEVLLNTPLAADLIRKGEVHELKALMTKGVGLGKPQPPQDYNCGGCKFHKPTDNPNCKGGKQ